MSLSALLRFGKTLGFFIFQVVADKNFSPIDCNGVSSVQHDYQLPIPGSYIFIVRLDVLLCYNRISVH